MLLQKSFAVETCRRCFPAYGRWAGPVGNLKLGSSRALFSLMVLVSLGTARTPAGGFITTPTYPAGYQPHSVAVADFNGDGVPDLAVANFNDVNGQDSTVSILLGNGDGTFKTTQNYPAGAGARCVALGDFNGDGILDLAVTNEYSNTISILLGNGDGTFQAPQGYVAGDRPYCVTVGDFNGDGIPDVAVANLGNYPDYKSGVSVLLGNGDGSFQAALRYPLPSVLAMTVGDFNGDGHLDLAVAGHNQNGSAFSVLLLLGNGDGTFQPMGNIYRLAEQPYSVAVGDFNRDGNLDFAIAADDKDGLKGTVIVLLGNGDGTFQAAHRYVAGFSASSVAVGDFNEDGNVDLALTNGRDYGGDTVTILLGNGDGTFQLARSYAAGSDPRSVAVGDFNHDGHLDLAVADYRGRSVSVLLGNGNGTFRAAPAYPFGGHPPCSVAVGDFNGDGLPDLAVTSWDNPGKGTIMLGNGDGTLRVGTNFNTAAGTCSIAVGDFNGDGKQDIVTGNSYVSGPPKFPDPLVTEVFVFLGNGDGKFPHAHNIYRIVGGPPLGGVAVSIGDLNGDGILDLAVANDNTGTVSILLGKGDGTFMAAQSYTVGGGPSSIVVGDFNGDGILDLAVNDSFHNTVSILLGNGDGSFQAPVSHAAGNNPGSLAVGDFNGDGILDLAVANNTWPNLHPGTVTILLGNGDGTFQAPQSYPVGMFPCSVAISDFNGDGILDLVVANRGSGTVSILLGKGDGTFQAAQDYASGNEPISVAVGDFNGDGLPDLAVANASGYSVTILLNVP